MFPAQRQTPLNTHYSETKKAKLCDYCLIARKDRLYSSKLSISQMLELDFLKKKKKRKETEAFNAIVLVLIFVLFRAIRSPLLRLNCELRTTL